MKETMRLAATVLFLAAGGCDDPVRAVDGGDDPAQRVEVRSDFSQGVDGWTTVLADYPLGMEEAWELQWGHRELLPPLDGGRRGIFLSGVNHSDDLLMGIWRRVDGLTPGAAYAVQVEVELATEAPTGCTGVGGSPGESVFLKAATSAVEPDRTVDDQGHHRLNVPMGNQADPGRSGQLLGTLGNGNTNCSNPVFALVERSSDAPLAGIADDAGRLWVVVAADSGFEGRTRLFFTRVNLLLERAGPG